MSHPESPSQQARQQDRGQRRAGGGRPLSRLQLAVAALATIPIAVIAVITLAAAVGVVSTETMIEVALAAGENPGMIVFGAMFLATPVQWLTGRSQIRIRKYLGVAFYLLSVSNLAMFSVDTGLGQALSAPFLVAGTFAVAVATPLFVTSTLWSQRALGIRRWRLLHKATYLVAIALVAHVALIPDPGLGSLMIIAGFLCRIPAVRTRLQAEGRMRSDIRSQRADDGESLLYVH